MIFHLIPAIVTIILIVVGHVKKRIRIANYNKRYNFTVDFNNKFFDFVNDFTRTHYFDNVKYESVIRNVDKIQEELGADGVLSNFHDPLKGIQGRNYQLFMNIIPELRSMQSSMDNSIMIERMNQLMGLCQDALYRHVGNLERAIENSKKGLYNPVSCMGEAIRLLVGLPIDFLYWAGIFSYRKSDSVKRSKFYKIIANVIVFIGLISSIVTIVIGWDEFTEMIWSCIGRK